MYDLIPLAAVLVANMNRIVATFDVVFEIFSSFMPVMYSIRDRKLRNTAGAYTSWWYVAFSRSRAAVDELLAVTLRQGKCALPQSSYAKGVCYWRVWRENTPYFRRQHPALLYRNTKPVKCDETY